MRLGQHLGARLPKPIALPAPPCICRDKKDPHPISAMNGNHETSSDTNHGTLSPGGLAVMVTLPSYRRLTRVGSLGA